jgi:hypothetical protein
MAWIYGVIALAALASALSWWDYTSLSLFCMAVAALGLLTTVTRIVRGYKPRREAPSETTFLRIRVGNDLKPWEASWPLAVIGFVSVCCVPVVAFLTQPLY